MQTVTVKPTKTDGWYAWATAEELAAYEAARLTARRMKVVLADKCKRRAAKAAMQKAAEAAK